MVRERRSTLNCGIITSTADNLQLLLNKKPCKDFPERMELSKVQFSNPESKAK